MKTITPSASRDAAARKCIIYIEKSLTFTHAVFALVPTMRLHFIPSPGTRASRKEHNTTAPLNTAWPTRRAPDLTVRAFTFQNAKHHGSEAWETGNARAPRSRSIARSTLFGSQYLYIHICMGYTDISCTHCDVYIVYSLIPISISRACDARALTPKIPSGIFGASRWPARQRAVSSRRVCVRLRGSRARGSHATRVITTTTKKCEWFGQTTKARDRAIGQGSDARMRGGVPKTIEEEFIYKVKVWMECIEHQRTILCAGWWWWSWWWFNGPWPIVYTRNARLHYTRALVHLACMRKLNARRGGRLGDHHHHRQDLALYGNRSVAWRSRFVFFFFFCNLTPIIIFGGIVVWWFHMQTHHSNITHSVMGNYICEINVAFCYMFSHNKIQNISKQEWIWLVRSMCHLWYFHFIGDRG